MQWKKVGFLGAAILLVAVSAMLFNYASTTTHEQDGVLGIGWAANIRDLPDMQLMAEDGDHRYYSRTGQEPKIEDITVDKIVYGFYKGRFFNVMAYFSSKPSFSKMKDRLARKYGNPFQPDQSDVKYFWTLDKVHSPWGGNGYGIPFSDHASFEDIVRYVEEARPRQIYTLFGPGDIAEYLRRLGYNAEVADFNSGHSLTPQAGSNLELFS